MTSSTLAWRSPDPGLPIHTSSKNVRPHKPAYNNSVFRVLYTRPVSTEDLREGYVPQTLRYLERKSKVLRRRTPHLQVPKSLTTTPWIDTFDDSSVQVSQSRTHVGTGDQSGGCCGPGEILPTSSGRSSWRTIWRRRSTDLWRDGGSVRFL